MGSGEIFPKEGCRTVGGDLVGGDLQAVGVESVSPSSSGCVGFPVSLWHHSDAHLSLCTALSNL